MRLLLALLIMTGMAHAEGERAGRFDYYVLALSWAPSWCDLEGDERGALQCDPARDAGWTLHGLWPQFERGWPSYCRGLARNPSRSVTAAEAPLYGSGGSAWHQWNKHGRCSGLSARAFYDLSAEAFEGIAKPEILRRITEEMRLRPSVIEAAFLEANPDLSSESVTITCKAGRIAEARICLTKDLEPRRCGSDVIRDCTATSGFPPIR